MPDDPTDKPSFTIAPGDLTLGECLALFRNLTGREATPEEVEELRRQMAKPVSGDSE